MTLVLDENALAEAIASRLAVTLPLRPKYLSIQTVAEELECSDEHVKSMIASEELEAIDIRLEGRKNLRVTETSLRAFLDRRRYKG